MFVTNPDVRIPHLFFMLYAIGDTFARSYFLLQKLYDSRFNEELVFCFVTLDQKEMLCRQRLCVIHVNKVALHWYTIIKKLYLNLFSGIKLYCRVWYCYLSSGEMQTLEQHVTSPKRFLEKLCQYFSAVFQHKKDQKDQRERRREIRDKKGQSIDYICIQQSVPQISEDQI